MGKPDYSHLESADLTDIGRRRKNNEDAVLRLPAMAVFCVADGMGGGQGGEIASKAVVDALYREFAETATPEVAVEGMPARSRRIGRVLNRASRWIKERAFEMGLTGTGTTSVVLAFTPVTPGRAMVLHAGDSRAYVFRDGTLEQITKDHSIAAAAGYTQEKDVPSMFRGVITRAVGIENEVQVDVTPADVRPHDLFLLCSDGLSKMLTDKALQKILRKHGTGDINVLAHTLIDEANQAGGEDNVSVVLVRVGDKLPEPIASESGPEDWSEIAKPADADGMEKDTGETRPLTPDTAGGGSGSAEAPHSDPDNLVCSTPETPPNDSKETGRRAAHAKYGLMDQFLDTVRHSRYRLIFVGLILVILGGLWVLARRERQFVAAVDKMPLGDAVTDMTATPRAGPGAADSAPPPVPVAAPAPGHETKATPAAVSNAAAPVVSPAPAMADNTKGAAMSAVPAPPPAKPAPPPVSAGNQALPPAQLFRMALASGNWGPLQESATNGAAWSDRAAQTNCATWVEKWRETKASDFDGPRDFAQYQDAMEQAAEGLGLRIVVATALVWKAEAGEPSDQYCRLVYGVQSAFLEAVDNAVRLHERQVAVFGNDVSGRMNDLWWAAGLESDPNSRTAAEIVPAIRKDLAALREWTKTVRSEGQFLCPGLTPQETVGLLKPVDGRTKALWESVYHAISQMDRQVAIWKLSASPETTAHLDAIAQFRAQVLRSRIPFGDDVRGWRAALPCDALEGLLKELQAVRPLLAAGGKP